MFIEITYNICCVCVCAEVVILPLKIPIWLYCLSFGTQPNLLYRHKCTFELMLILCQKSCAVVGIQRMSYQNVQPNYFECYHHFHVRGNPLRCESVHEAKSQFIINRIALTSLNELHTQSLQNKFSMKILLC